MAAWLVCDRLYTRLNRGALFSWALANRAAWVSQQVQTNRRRPMGTLQLVSSLVLIGVGCHAADGPPRLRLREVEEITSTAYRVDLTVDPTKDSFTGAISISVTAKVPTNTVWLNASRIKIEDASYIAGGNTLKAEVVPGGDDFVGLRLVSPAPAGTGEIRIRWVP
jgi:Peptidase M1 N-terminal domain